MVVFATYFSKFPVSSSVICTRLGELGSVIGHVEMIPSPSLAVVSNPNCDRRWLTDTGSDKSIERGANKVLVKLPT